MAKVCDLCGRGPVGSQSRSHSNISSKRRLFINLHSKKVPGGRIKICTRCLRTATKIIAGK